MYIIYANSADNLSTMQPEKSMGYDLGVEKNFPSLNLNLDLTYFDNIYKNALEGWKSNIGTATYATNNTASEVKSRGIELMSDWKANDILSFALNFTYTHTYDGAEADDVIATLTRKHHLEEKILILSADKDFIQLQRHNSVKQYDPIRNRWIDCEDPISYLQEHIIRGDRSDGIPNILTCDDAIVNGKAQKKMSKEKISALASMDPSDFTNYIRLRNWKRNSELIDFAKIPRPIVDNILMTFSKYRVKSSIDLQYFIDNNIQDLIEEFS